MHQIPEPAGKRFERLQALGIFVPAQILLHLPKSYIDMTNVEKNVRESHLDGLQRIYSLNLDSKPDFSNRFGTTPRVSFYVSDEYNQYKVNVFGNLYEWKSLEAGTKVFIRGKIKTFNNEITLDAPELIKSHVIGKVVPKYRGKKKVIAEETMAEYAQEALISHIDETVEYIRRSLGGFDEKYLLEKSGISAYKSLKDILIDIHSPSSIDKAEIGMLAARKLAAFEAVKGGMEKANKKPEPRSAILIKKNSWTDIIKSIPYPPTNDQIQAIEEIITDLSKPYTMSRLLQGDVGTGKSYVIGVTAMLVNISGGTVAIMTPNILLVDQLYNDFTKWWPRKKFLKVTGTTKNIDMSENPILIGTVALLSRLTKQKVNISYLVVDEQEKFSTKQREQLLKVNTNMLEATATCIPRTAAMIVHGGMDISILTESPVKKKINTYLLDKNDRSKLFDHVHRVIESGFQVAIVYPQVSGGDEKKSANEAFNVWNKKYPGKVVCVHGKMAPEDKLNSIQRAKNGEFPVIVTTTLIERGVTIPKLRACVVVNPERYGVTLLHQLRGRLVRKGGVGYFFLYTPDPIDNETYDRLNLLVNLEKGHELAEMDMEARGFGDLSEGSDMQHGASISCLFHGCKLKPSDIKQVMEVLG